MAFVACMERYFLAPMNRPGSHPTWRRCAFADLGRPATQLCRPGAGPCPCRLSDCQKKAVQTKTNIICSTVGLRPLFFKDPHPCIFGLINFDALFTKADNFLTFAGHRFPEFITTI
jgi:hypothetical protein